MEIQSLAVGTSIHIDQNRVSLGGHKGGWVQYPAIQRGLCSKGSSHIMNQKGIGEGGAFALDHTVEGSWITTGNKVLAGV